MCTDTDRTALSGRAAAGSRTAVRNLWRGLLPVLLCLSLFLGFSAEAQAQANCSASDTAVTAVASGASATMLATECTALLNLLQTLRGTGEALNWANSLSMADWEGITLSANRVTKVEVSRKMFNGTISSSIATLTELTNLLLEANEITGPIPDLSALTKLEWLQLNDNKLTGTINVNHIPASLVSLSLSANNLSGPFPDLSKFTSLQIIGLHRNNLTGNVSTLTGNNLSTVTSITINNNRLSGEVPNLAHMTGLRRLAISDNDFTGDFPTLDSAAPLGSVLAHRNGFSGSIPDFSSYESLETLALSDNEFSGTINASHLPEEKLRDLYLHRNKLTGSLPSMNAFTSLRYFYVHGNQLSGALPTTWDALTSLQQLHLSFNSFTGAIPSGLDDLDALVHLSLCSTNLDSSATLPTDLETRRTASNLTLFKCIWVDDAEAAEGSAIQFTVDYNIFPLKGSSGEAALQLSYETEDITATDGSDYTGTSSGSVTIPAITSTTASSSSATFSVQTTADSVAEPDETFIVRLGDLPDGLAGRSSAVGKIQGTQEVEKPTTVWIRSSVTVNVCELNGSGVPASVCESDNNSPERKQCEAAWTPAWAKPGAVARSQVSQANINAARASVDAICGYNASAVYVSERHGRDEITVTEGGAAGRITVGLSKKLGAGKTVTVPLTASGVANGDYTIALHTGTNINTGVTLETSNPYSAARPAVAFTGHATDEVRFASLNVSGVSDSANEGSETLTLGIGTVTNTNTAGTQLHRSFQTARVRIKDAGSPAQAAPAPTETVANLQVTAVDDTSASATWDAVPHATSYDVSWSAESSDSPNASAGAESVTGTTATIRHDASVAMTLTVTVTPEYVDKNGDTQQLDALAGTATIDVGPSGGSSDGVGGTSGTVSVEDGTDGSDGAVEPGPAPVAVNIPAAVAHWRFDGDAFDGAGSSHGTTHGGAAFEANEDGSGVGSHALVLDGSDDYVDLASHVSNFPLGDAARTVTGWFHADAGNQGQTFLSYGPNVAGQRFSIAADRTQAVVGVSSHAWGVNGLDLADGWHHVAVTHSGGDSDGISIYLDGALQSASTLAGSPQRLDTRTGSATVGRNAGGTKHYAGSMDDGASTMPRSVRTRCSRCSTNIRRPRRR